MKDITGHTFDKAGATGVDDCRRSGMKQMFIVWFLFLAVVPVLVTGLICHEAVKRNKLRDSEAVLRAILDDKTREVKHYFDRIMKDAGFISGVVAESSEAVPLVGLLQKAMAGHGYYDVLLMDTAGTIRVSASAHKMEGTRFNRSPYFGNHFQNGYIKAARSDTPVLSDFEKHGGPNGDVISASVFSSVKKNGVVSGVIAVRFGVETLNGIMAGGMEAAGIYLLGQDMEFRTDYGRHKPPQSLKRKIHAEQIREMETASYPAGISPVEHAVAGTGLMHYENSYGSDVLGMGRLFSVNDTRFWLIAETDKQKALAVAVFLKKMVVMAALASSVMGCLAALALSWKFARPVQELALWAKEVAGGCLNFREITMPENEIADVYKNFRSVVSSLNDTAGIAKSISEGNYLGEVRLKSENDEVGMSLERVNQSLYEAAGTLETLAGGDYDTRMKIKGRNDLLAKSVNRMALTLKETLDANEKQDLLKTRQAELNEILRGEQDMSELTSRVLSFLCKSLGAGTGTFYVVDNQRDSFTLFSSYAFDRRKNLSGKLYKGDGLAGQAVMEKRKIVLDNCPPDFVAVNSASGAAAPVTVAALPLVLGDEVVGVIEMGMFNPVRGNDVELLELVAESISIAVKSALSRTKMTELLDKTVRQAEDLTAQREVLNSINRDLEKKTTELQETEHQLRVQEKELRSANEDLRFKTEKLMASESRLKAQEEELLTANEELETRSRYLEQQKNAINEKNTELEKTQKKLIEKSKKLEASSKYKSEFLANMSHELRTPLNSILLISRILCENRDGNLTNKQAQLSKTVYTSGVDLMILIDDVLDLAKIESGKLTIMVQKTRINDLEEKITDNFADMAHDKGIDLIIEVGEKVPEFIYMDLQRVEQVVKNLVSNAMKFTSAGYVKLAVAVAETLPESLRADHDPGEVLRISVEDTGPGIPESKKKLIFEAFQQADGTISREFGGTGLGLSISKELTRLLGGEMTLESIEGEGSIFSVFLPNVLKEPETLVPVDIEMPEAIATTVIDRVREGINIVTPETGQGSEIRGLVGKKVLIVDDDMRNVYALMSALENDGLEIIVGRSGEEGLGVLKQHPDTDIVLMDIMMPVMSGLEAIDQIRSDERFSGLPVIALTAKAMKGDAEKCIEAGASDYVSKPVDIDRLRSIMNELAGDRGSEI